MGELDLITSFEELLCLPAGILHEPELNGEWLNRSLSVHEVSLLLTVNHILEPHGLAPEDVERLLYKGATARMLDECPAPDRDAQLILPPWAVEPAVARSRQYAEAIAATGVRVIGDLEELSRPPRTDRGRWELSTTIPVEVAAQAVAGALSAGLGRGSNFGLSSGVQPRPVPSVLGRVRRLPSAVWRRLRHAPSRISPDWS